MTDEAKGDAASAPASGPRAKRGPAHGGWGSNRAEVMRVQVRMPTKGWTRARRKRFLELLAETCNASYAAKAVGMSSAGAYLLRRRDAGFERLWHQAMEHGRERLEQKLLAHAMGTGDDARNPRADELELEPSGESLPFDPALAIKVLALDRGRVRVTRDGARTVTQAEVDAALMTRLEQLGARLAAAPDAAEREAADRAALAALLARRGSGRSGEAGA